MKSVQSNWTLILYLCTKFQRYVNILDYHSRNPSDDLHDLEDIQSFRFYRWRILDFPILHRCNTIHCVDNLWRIYKRLRYDRALYYIVHRLHSTMCLCSQEVCHSHRMRLRSWHHNLFCMHYFYPFDSLDYWILI